MSFVVSVACSGSLKVSNGRRVGLRPCRSSSAAVNFPEDHVEKQPSKLRISSQEKLVQELVLKQEALVKERRSTNHKIPTNHSWDVNDAYHRCLKLAATDIGAGSLGASPHPLLDWFVFTVFDLAKSLLLSPEEQEQLGASAALYVWCRKTDELMDGNNGRGCTPEILERWEQRLMDTYEGRPHDIYDAALSYTLSKYPIDLQLLKDLIQGAKMDLSKTRYQDFDELNLYIYRNCGAPFLMFVQLTPAEHKASLYKAALAYAALCQLTDFLRDVIEDAEMGRIYFPQDELARAGLSEDDIYNGDCVSDEWRSFMKEQVKRARAYADEGDKYLDDMSLVYRICFSVVSLSNRHFLDRIEANDYDLSKPTPVKVAKLFLDTSVSCVQIIMRAKYHFS